MPLDAPVVTDIDPVAVVLPLGLDDTGFVTRAGAIKISLAISVVSLGLFAIGTPGRQTQAIEVQTLFPVLGRIAGLIARKYMLRYKLLSI